MNSFLSRIFGGRRGGEPASSSHDSETYKDCTITPTPMREGSQWRIAGTIMKVVDGETKERTFIRADLFSSADECANFTIRKARQIIDQNPALFAGGATGTA